MIRASAFQSFYTLVRQQSWLYDRDHDSMHWGYRHAAHGVLRVATRVAGLRYRLVPRVKPGDLLNVGSGRSPLPGWVNLDINPFSGAQLWVDVRDRWPVKDATVSVVYTRHCMEHFTEKDLSAILRQCYRVLQPGGGIRIGVPSLETAIQQYLRRDFAFAGWLDQTAPMAKTFIRYITDNGNHPILLDFEYLERMLGTAGFMKVTKTGGGESKLIEPSLLAPGDSAADWASLYVEARKPTAS